LGIVLLEIYGFFKLPEDGDGAFDELNMQFEETVV